MSQAQPKSPVKHTLCAVERRVQNSRENLDKPPEKADPRALALLVEVRNFQRTLPRGPALAWERVAFGIAFLGEEPRRRVRAFLAKGK